MTQAARKREETIWKKHYESQKNILKYIIFHSKIASSLYQSIKLYKIFTALICVTSCNIINSIQNKEFIKISKF